MVSVIIRTCNRPDALCQAVESVAAQTWPDLEIVVVNDGLGTLDLPEIKEIPVHVLSTGNAGNRSCAANVGAGQARGRFLLFLDDDDLIEKDHIQTLMSALNENPWCAAGYCGTVIQEHPQGRKTYVPIPRFDLASLLGENLFAIHSVLLRKSAFDAVSGFDESLTLFEDWDLWIRLALGGFGFIPVQRWSAVYRRHAQGTLTAHPFGTHRDIEARWKVILKHEQDIRNLLTARKGGAASIKLILRKLLFKAAKDLLC